MKATHPGHAPNGGLSENTRLCVIAWPFGGRGRGRARAGIRRWSLRCFFGHRFRRIFSRTSSLKSSRLLRQLARDFVIHCTITDRTLPHIGLRTNTSARERREKKERRRESGAPERGRRARASDRTSRHPRRSRAERERRLEHLVADRDIALGARRVVGTADDGGRGRGSWLAVGGGLGRGNELIERLGALADLAHVQQQQRPVESDRATLFAVGLWRLAGRELVLLVFS